VQRPYSGATVYPQPKQSVGSTYANEFNKAANIATVQERLAAIDAAAAIVKKTADVLIIGGGLVRFDSFNLAFDILDGILGV
jgi:hypothetical protein